MPAGEQNATVGVAAGPRAGGGRGSGAQGFEDQRLRQLFDNGPEETVDESALATALQDTGIPLSLLMSSSTLLSAARPSSGLNGGGGGSSSSSAAPASDLQASASGQQQQEEGYQELSLFERQRQQQLYDVAMYEQQQPGQPRQFAAAADANSPSEYYPQPSSGILWTRQQPSEEEAVVEVGSRDRDASGEKETAGSSVSKKEGTQQSAVAQNGRATAVTGPSLKVAHVVPDDPWASPSATAVKSPPEP